MLTKYEELCQIYLQNFEKDRTNKKEAGILLSAFVKSFLNYLGCPPDNLIFIKKNLDFTKDVLDAIYQNDAAPPWILNFAIKIYPQIDLEEFISVDQPKYSIQISTRKLVALDNSWEIAVSFSAVKKTVIVSFRENNFENMSENEFNELNEINEFIYEKSLSDLRSYYKRYLSFYEGSILSKPSLGFVSPSLQNINEHDLDLI